MASQWRGVWSRRAPCTPLIIQHVSLSMWKLTLVKAAKHSILSMNLAIIYKYLLDYFNSTLYNSTLQNATQSHYECRAFMFSMLFQNTDSKTLKHTILCLSKENFHEIRKRRNCRLQKISLVSLPTLSTNTLLMRKNNRISSCQVNSPFSESFLERKKEYNRMDFELRIKVPKVQVMDLPLWDLSKSHLCGF